MEFHKGPCSYLCILHDVLDNKETLKFQGKTETNSKLTKSTGPDDSSIRCQVPILICFKEANSQSQVIPTIMPNKTNMFLYNWDNSVCSANLSCQASGTILKNQLSPESQNSWLFKHLLIYSLPENFYHI